MTLETLRQFFLWCMLINFGMYLITTLALFAFRPLVFAMHRKLFLMDEAATSKAMHQYLGAHKLLTLVLCFVPWLALLILR